MGPFSGGAAHDVNTPPTVIGSSLELLRRPQLKNAQRDNYVQTLAVQVMRRALHPRTQPA